MRPSEIERVANAVLYEGYILYPYRPSALKNRQRWNFGGLCPPAYSEVHPDERSQSQTECLVIGDERTAVQVKLRFLHPISLRVASVPSSVANPLECPKSDLEFVDSLLVGNQVIHPRQEATECEIELPEFAVTRREQPLPQFSFHAGGSETVEPVHDPLRKVAGVVVREQDALDGSAFVELERLQPSLFKLTLRLLNVTSMTSAETCTRDEAMMHSLVSTHSILTVKDGEFVSLLDPPEVYAAAAAQCENIGTYPVLIGAEGERSAVLSSPVILYDYPQIAAESRGDLCDATEIDEILTLRILALSDEEKAEVRQGDPRAREILERIETDPEHLARLHGTMRDANRLLRSNTEERL